MMRFLRANPFVVLLMPLMIIICICNKLPNNPLCHTGEVDYLSKDTFLCAWVTHIPEEKDKTIWLQTDILENNGRAYLYVWKDSAARTINQGDILLVNTTINRGDTLDGFDYGLYLWRQGIVGQGFVRTNEWSKIGHKDVHTPRAITEKWRTRILQTYRNAGITNPNFGILAALTTGYRESLDDRTQQQFVAAGAMHILAVSGLHVGVIYAILLFLLKYIEPIRLQRESKLLRIINCLIIIIALWTFACMSGLSPSVVRASLMCSLFQIGIAAHRQISTYNIIAAAAFFILLCNPMALFSISFQLSFAAVLSIVYFGQRFMFIRFRNSLLRNTIGYVEGLIACSIAAQLGTIPITLYYLGQTSNAFLLTNLLVIPLAGIIIYTAIFFLMVSAIPFIGHFASIILNAEISCLYKWTNFIENLPHSTFHLQIDGFQVALLYIAIIFAALAFHKEKYAYFIGTFISLALFMFV